MCFYSDIKVNSLVVNSTKASILYADRSTSIVFHGQNVFFNNNINSSISHGSLMQYRSNTTCYIRRNISFIENNKVLDNFGGSPLDSNHLTSAAISLRSASTLVISGKALFVRNRVITPSTGHIFFSGGGPGAIYVDGQAKVIFEETSNISFVENSAVISGGAMYLLDGANLTMCGRVLFEANSAQRDGGAIAIEGGTLSTTMMECNEKNITFRNNTVGQLQYYDGGAVYSKNARVELKNVLFERNTAHREGAVYAQGEYNTSYVTIEDSRFENNTAMRDGGAIYAADILISITSTMHFVGNSAQTGGAIAFGPLDITGSFLSKLLLNEPLKAYFTENSATVSGGVVFFQDDVCVSQSCDVTFPSFSRFNCFVEFSSTTNMMINFNNNSAETAGEIFYGGNLDTCVPVVNGTVATYIDRDRLRPLNIITNISNINVKDSNYMNNTTSYVSSDPLQVCICTNDGLQCRFFW